MDFVEFPKIARLSRECTITEKIDGTNGVIQIGEDGSFHVGSRTRWLTPETGDNHGFLLWAMTNKDELMKLGPGRHFGEWWGSGIQRGYGLQKGEKRFSLFNTYKWSDTAGARPACCHVVPVLFNGLFTSDAAEQCLSTLKNAGSYAAPGFMNPEGVIIYHHMKLSEAIRIGAAMRPWHGSQFKDAALIVGSSPCQEFSYRAMPWKRRRKRPWPSCSWKRKSAAVTKWSPYRLLARSRTAFTQPDSVSFAFAAAREYRSSRSSDTLTVSQRRSPSSTGGLPLGRLGLSTASLCTNK